MKKILTIVLVLVLVAGMVGALGVVTNGFKKWDLNNAKENAEQWAAESRAQIDALKERIEELREKIEKKDDENGDENGDDQNGENNNGDDQNGGDDQSGDENGQDQSGDQNGQDQSGDQNGQDQPGNQDATPSSLADLDGVLSGFVCNDYVAGIEVDTSVNPAFIDAYLAAFDEDVELVSFDGDAGIAVQEGGLVVFGSGKGLVYAPASKTIEGVTFAKGWTLISDLDEMTVAAYDGDDLYSFTFVLPLRVTAVDGTLGDLNTTVVGESAANALTSFFGASTTLPILNAGSYVDGILVDTSVDPSVMLSFMSAYPNGVTFAQFGNGVSIGINEFESTEDLIFAIFDEDNSTAVMYCVSSFDLNDDQGNKICSIPSGWSQLTIYEENDVLSAFVAPIEDQYQFSFALPEIVSIEDPAFAVLNGRLIGAYVESPCLHVYVDGVCVRCGTYEVCEQSIHSDNGSGVCQYCGEELYHFDTDEDGICDNCGINTDDVNGDGDDMSDDVDENN